MIEILEKILNEKAEAFDESSMRKIIGLINDENEQILNILKKENFKKFSSELREKNESFFEKYIRKTLSTFLIEEEEKEIILILKDENKTNEEKIKKIKRRISENSDEFVLICDYIGLIYCDSDIVKVKEEIQNTARKTIEICKNAEMENDFLLVNKWTSMIYLLEEIFFESSKEKLFNDEERKDISEISMKMNSFILEMSKEIMGGNKDA